MWHFDMCNVILSLFFQPIKMPKAHSKSTAMDKEDPHGSINLAEAKAHVDSLDKVMTMIGEQVEEKKDTADLLEEALNDMKDSLATLTPMMQLVDTSTVTQAIQDKCFKVLLPRSDKLDQILKEIIPNEEIMGTPEVLRVAQKGGGEMSKTNQRVVAELFESLETAQDQMATACGILGRLSRTLKPDQLMTIIKASIRPLIQLNTLTTLDTATTSKKPPELPQEQPERVKLMLAPDPRASLLGKEKINSVTRLLVATYTFKIFKQIWTWYDTKANTRISGETEAALPVPDSEKIFRGFQ